MLYANLMLVSVPLAICESIRLYLNISLPYSKESLPTYYVCSACTIIKIEQIKFSTYVYFLRVKRMSSPFLDLDGNPILGEQLLGYGGSGIVIRHGQVAVKMPLRYRSSSDDEVDANIGVIQREQEIYRRLGQCDGVVLWDRRLAVYRWKVRESCASRTEG